MVAVEVAAGQEQLEKLKFLTPEVGCVCLHMWFANIPTWPECTRGTQTIAM